MFIAGKKSFPSTATATLSAMTLISQNTKVGEISKQEISNISNQHLLLIYHYRFYGEMDRIEIENLFFEIDFLFYLDSEITKVTEQLLQAIANSDYESYK
jgi:hypothetical protein